MKKACAHARSIAALGFVLAGVLLLCCPDAWALDPALDVSQYAHTSWKVRDGFTKGSIYAIAQTSDGYLWLGTEFGLFRFDGVRAVPWELQGQALPSTYITRLFAASDGTLWIGTLKGLASWKDGNLTAYPELADHVVLQMIEDREGTVWTGTVGTAFGTTTGRLCAIRKGGVQCFEDGSFKAGVTGLYEDSKGTLWAGVKDGLWRWKPGPPKFFSLPTRVATSIEALGEDTNGTVLFGWRGGLWRFLDGKTEAYPLPRVQFRARQLLRDRDGGLWVATQDRGIAHVHAGKTDMFSVSEGLSGEDSEFVFQDREGSIWIARDLHDSLLQGVQGLMFRLQAVRELLPGHPSEAMKALDTALERGDKVIVEGRDTISDLRQSAVGDSDIAQALTALGEELAAQSNNGTAPCVRVLVEGKRREIDPVLRDEIYRIAREALRNAFRHSEAQKIEAQITYGESEFLLHVRDDGIGIAPQVASQGARAGHWGLPGMRERAKGFGGKLEVWSEQGAGTEIELTIPAAVSYGKSNARRKSWFLRKKN